MMSSDKDDVSRAPELCCAIQPCRCFSVAAAMMAGACMGPLYGRYLQDCRCKVLAGVQVVGHHWVWFIPRAAQSFQPTETVTARFVQILDAGKRRNQAKKTAQE